MTRYAPHATGARRALALAILLPLLAGCGGRPASVAKVGDSYITEDDFKDAARGNEQQYQGSPDSAKTALLNDIVKRQVLVAEARKRHLLPDSTIDRMKRQEADKLAVEALFTKLVPRDIPVSDGEVADMYKRRAVQAHMNLIFVMSKADAEAAKAELAKGEDFAAVANRHNVQGMLPPGGDLGFAPPGSLIEPLDGYLYDGPLNKVQGPDEIQGQGWCVSKVLERKPREQEPLEQQKPTLKQMIKQRKQRTLQQQAFTSLERQYHVQLEGGAGQAMFQLFNAPTGAKPPVDSTKVLAHYDGEKGAASYTVHDAIADLSDPSQQRPNNSNLALIERWIELQVVRKTTMIEAGRRHLAQDPSVQRHAAQRVDNALLQQLYAAEVASRVAPPTPEEIHAAFERRSSAFQKLESAKVKTLTIPDSAAAVGLLAHMGHMTGGIATLSGMLPPGTKKTMGERELKYPSKDPGLQQLQPMLMGMSPGDVRGPVKNPGGWVVYELVAKVQGLQDYASLQPGIQQALQQEAGEIKRDQRLAAFADSLRSAMKIEIYHDKLKKLPWPVPPEGGSS